MINTIWTDISFRLSVLWIDLVILITILIFHSYRTCYLHKDRKGSSIRIFKFISFQHLSFIVIITSILPALQQAIIYTPQEPITDEMCKFTLIFGIIFLSFAKLALHLFVTVRSQVIRNNTTSIWFKIGLIMVISDVLYIFYVLSGIPTIIAIQHGVLCKPIYVSLPVYIWFAMNDFIIGCYCLLAFILPLRKYVSLEEDKEETTIVNEQNNDTELKPLITRIIIYSSMALISTMVITIISSVVNESGGALFGIDSVINSICVVLQFCSNNNNDINGFKLCPWMKLQAKSLETASPRSTVSTPPTISNNNVSMVIHSMPKTKPQLKDNVSLSVSLVENEDVPDLCA